MKSKNRVERDKVKKSKKNDYLDEFTKEQEAQTNPYKYYSDGKANPIYMGRGKPALYGFWNLFVGIFAFLIGGVYFFNKIVQYSFLKKLVDGVWQGPFFVFKGFKSLSPNDIFGLFFIIIFGTFFSLVGISYIRRGIRKKKAAKEIKNRQNKLRKK